MTRRLWSAATLFAAALATAAPVPKAAKGKNQLFPYPVGTKWGYAGPSSPNKVEEEREITSVEEKDGATYATMKCTYDTRVLRIDDSGVAEVGTGDRVYKNPRVILKAGMKEGDTWEGDEDGYTHTRTIGKAEKVTVPAGEFEATRIEWKSVKDGKTFRGGTVWYASGVGLVRAYEEGHTDDVLSTFTLGKEKEKK